MTYSYIKTWYNKMIKVTNLFAIIMLYEIKNFHPKKFWLRPWSFITSSPYMLLIISFIHLYQISSISCIINILYNFLFSYFQFVSSTVFSGRKRGHDLQLSVYCYKIKDCKSLHFCLPSTILLPAFLFLYLYLLYRPPDPDSDRQNCKPDL